MNLPQRSGLLILLTFGWFALAQLGLASSALAQHDQLWLDGATVDGERTSPYADLVDRVGPAVVNVQVAYQNGPDSSMRSFPGMPQNIGEGSGFIIHPDGYAITNYHVINNAQSVVLQFANGKELNAQVLGGDPQTDIALLKAETSEPLPTVSLGDSSSVRVGDAIVAIGNPLGLSHSVTAGIISALDRRDLPIEGQKHEGNFIQLDAPINPGNSGGPLIDMNGDVIGINTAVNRQGQGISFAVPINLVKTLLPQLESRGHVLRSWLGVRWQPMDPLLASSFGREDNRGALVTEVVEDSPAGRAGLQERDIVISIDDDEITHSEDLPLRIATIEEGTEISLGIIRDGERISLPVQLEALPDQTPPDIPTIHTDSTDFDDNGLPAGIEVESMTERLSRQLSAPEGSGVVVTSVADGSPANIAGLRDRDVIIRVSGQQVDTEEEFQSALHDLSAGEIVRLHVLRSGRPHYLAFER